MTDICPTRPDKWAQIVLSGIFVTLLSVSPCAADAVSDFYQGKTVSMVIGSAPGGVFDPAGRLMARHLQNFIPGSPKIVPQNMPGASSVRAASYVYNVAPRDGTMLGSVMPTVVINKLLDPAANYEPQNYNWIGRIEMVTLVGIAWTGARHHTMEDAKQNAMIMGASGASGTGAIVPWALNRLAGTRFQVVLGYESQAPFLLAMERGELEGAGSATLSVLQRQNQDWIKNKKINFLYSITPERTPQLPDVPALPEFGRDELGKTVLRLIGGVTTIGLTAFAPPGVPSDRVAALRQAFVAMTKSPEFLADSQKLGFESEPLSGDELQKFVEDYFSVTEEAKAKLREVVRPQR